MPQEKILVVDDEAPVRDIVANLLERGGYSPVTASGANEALERLDQDANYSLVLSDIMMPGTDGLALLDRISTDHPELPVIMFSAVRDIHVATSAFRRGAFDYLIKPFERLQLENVVARAAEHRRHLRQNIAYRQHLEEVERFLCFGQFEAALKEIRAGAKRGHWIWYVFPQIAGLGMSSMSRLYAIRDRDEAEAYLRHPVLFPRLLEITGAVAAQVRKEVAIDDLMGSSIDAAKLVSSMTLFRGVASRLQVPAAEERLAAFVSLADEILAAALREGYPPCKESLAITRPHG